MKLKSYNILDNRIIHIQLPRLYNGIICSSDQKNIGIYLAAEHLGIIYINGIAINANTLERIEEINPKANIQYKITATHPHDINQDVNK